MLKTAFATLAIFSSLFLSTAAGAQEQTWVEESKELGNYETAYGDGYESNLVVANPHFSAGSALRLALVIKNTGDEEKILTFRSSQQLEIEITTVDGQLVSRLSDGKAFLQVITEMVLAAGEEKVLTAEIPMVDQNGKTLVGEYVVHAYLKSFEPASKVSMNVASAE